MMDTFKRHGLVFFNPATSGDESQTPQNALRASKATTALIGTNGPDGAEALHSANGDDLLFGTDDVDEIHALAGNDEVHGGFGGDSIFGDGGDDLLIGGGGNDLLYGKEDDDVLSGGEGDDVLFGGDGVDWLFSGDGNDFLMAGPGAAFLFGGGDFDTVSYLDAATGVFVNLPDMTQNTGEAAQRRHWRRARRSIYRHRSIPTVGKKR